MELILDTWGMTHSGKKRAHNEDTYFIKADHGVLAIADGMGGAAAGELASRLFRDCVAQVFQHSMSQSAQMSREWVIKAFTRANHMIREHARHNPEHAGMGCTAELMSFYPGGYVLGHIGDSRSYRYRKTTLSQLSRDHSLVQDQIDRGIISTDQAASHSMRHVILRAVGMDDSISVDLIQGAVAPGDIYLLCSDGLSDMISSNRIQDILDQKSSLDQAGRELINMALEAGGLDNTTVVLASISTPWQ